jgi:hypothetical protein
VQRAVVWESLDGPGVEHLRLSQSAAGLVASGVVNSMRPQYAFRLHYVVSAGPDWRVNEITLNLAAPTTSELHLHCDEQLHWRHHDGEPVPELDGCAIVDISATPFTNTLAIRRGDLEPGQSRQFDVAYFAVPELRFSRVRQRYTCLERGPSGGRYRYEGLGSGFSAELRVDADGLVIDYPGLFRRLPPDNPGTAPAKS